MSLAAKHGIHQASLMAMFVLFIALVQGTSTTLTLVYQLAPSLEPVVSAVWGMAYLMALVGLVANFGINWLTWLVRYRLLLCLLLVGTAFSAMWSLDAALTTERTIHLFGTTAIAFYIGFTIPLTRILSFSAVVLGLLMFASVFAALLIPTIGIENYEGQLVWRGVMTSKNTLGFWSAITVLLCAVVMGNTPTLAKKALCLLGMAFGFIALIFSDSATSLLALAVSALMMTYLYIAFRFELGLISTIVLGILFASLAAFAFLNIDTAELIGRSGDMTGRGEVWQQTWQLILKQPLTGYGYGTIWFPKDGSIWIQKSLTDFTWVVYHAHNGLLQLASEIGIPLTALAVLMIIQQLIEIIYCQYQRQQAGVLFVLGFTVALMISNYSEARLMINRELYWIFFIALPISMLQQVTLKASGTTFYPMPATLHKRTRDKQATYASDRQHRQELKHRLRSRYDTEESNQDIIDGDESFITSKSIVPLPLSQSGRNQSSRHQKKTGS